MSTEAAFKAAAARAAAADFPNPSRAQKLQLYGLFKQATKGPIGSTKRPGALDPVARAKHDAWAANESLSSAAAQAEYIALVQTVDPSFKPPALPSSPEVSAPSNQPTVAAAAPAPASAPPAAAAPSETSIPPSERSATSAAATANAASSFLPASSSRVEAATSARKPSVAIRGIEVPKYTDLEDEQGFRFTVYNIRVTQSDGKVWMIGRRYNEVAELHAALSTSCAHPSFSAFKFPNKSILNTFSSHTMERRRSGFEAFFQMLVGVIKDGDAAPVADLAALLNVPVDTVALLCPNYKPSSSSSSPKPSSNAAASRASAPEANGSRSNSSSSNSSGSSGSSNNTAGGGAPAVGAAASRTQPNPPVVSTSAANGAAGSGDSSSASGSAAASSATSGAASAGEPSKEQLDRANVRLWGQKGPPSEKDSPAEVMRKVAALRERRAEAKKSKGFSAMRVAQTIGSVVAGFGLTAAAGFVDVSRIAPGKATLSVAICTVMTILFVDYLFSRRRNLSAAI